MSRVRTGARDPWQLACHQQATSRFLWLHESPLLALSCDNQQSCTITQKLFRRVRFSERNTVNLSESPCSVWAGDFVSRFSQTRNCLTLKIQSPVLVHLRHKNQDGMADIHWRLADTKGYKHTLNGLFSEGRQGLTKTKWEDSKVKDKSDSSHSWSRTYSFCPVRQNQTYQR